MSDSGSVASGSLSSIVMVEAVVVGAGGVSSACHASNK